MSDKELLELAAKAAGNIPAPLVWVRQFDEDLTPINNRGEPWNPLTDDGDALRLAVKLNLSILRPVNGDNPEHYGTYAMLPDQRDFGKVRDAGDPAAATRRAIVRAAAALAGDTGGEAR